MSSSTSDNPLGLFSDGLVFLTDGGVTTGQDVVGVSRLLLPQGSASLPALAFSQSEATGIHLIPAPSPGQPPAMGLTVEGATAMIVTSDGRVRVGGAAGEVECPSAAPAAALTVLPAEGEDGMRISSAAGDASISLSASGEGAVLSLQASTGTLLVKTNDTARLTVAPGGMVGVGTEDPQHALHVEGDMFVSGNILTPSGVLAGNADTWAATTTPVVDPGPRLALPFETFTAIATPFFPSAAAARTALRGRDVYVAFAETRISKVALYHRFTCAPPPSSPVPTFVARLSAGGREEYVQVECAETLQRGEVGAIYAPNFPSTALAHRWTLDGHPGDALHPGPEWNLSASSGADAFPTAPPPPVGRSFATIRKRTHLETMANLPFGTQEQWSLGFWYRLDKVVFTGQFAGMIMRPKGVLTGTATDAVTNFDLFRQAGMLRATGFVGGEAHYMATADGAIAQGAWHHICVQRDGAILRLYLDGEAAGQVPSTNFVDARLSFPTSAGGDTDFFSICDVCFHTRVLTQAEVQAMSSTVTAPPMPWGGVELQQPFELHAGESLSVEVSVVQGAVTAADHAFSSACDVLLFHEMRTGPLAASNPTHPMHAVNAGYVAQEVDRRWRLDAPAGVLTTPAQRVGVGVDQPQATLHVAGDLRVDGAILRDGDPYWWRPRTNPGDPGVDERKVVHDLSFALLPQHAPGQWHRAGTFLAPHAAELKAVRVVQRGRASAQTAYRVRLSVAAGGEVTFDVACAAALEEGEGGSTLVYAAPPPTLGLLRRWVSHARESRRRLPPVTASPAADEDLVLGTGCEWQLPSSPPPVGVTFLSIPPLGTAFCLNAGVAPTAAAWTVAAWFRVNEITPSSAASVTVPLASLGGETLVAVRVQRDGPYFISAFVLPCTTAPEAAFGTAAIGQWVHVRVLCDESGVRLGLNGEPATFGAPAAVEGTGQDLALGGGAAGVDVCDACVFSRRLSDGEAAFVGQRQAVATAFWGVGEGGGSLVVDPGQRVTVDVEDATPAARGDALEHEALDIALLHADRRIFREGSLNPTFHHTVTSGSMSVPPPSHPTHAATKAYVDAKNVFGGPGEGGATSFTVHAQHGEEDRSFHVSETGEVTVRGAMTVHGPVTLAAAAAGALAEDAAVTRGYVDALRNDMCAFEPGRVLVSGEDGRPAASEVHAQDVEVLAGVVSDHPPPTEALLFLNADNRIYGYPWLRVADGEEGPRLEVGAGGGGAPVVKVRAAGGVDVGGVLNVSQALDVRGTLTASHLKCESAFLEINASRSASPSGSGIDFLAGEAGAAGWRMRRHPATGRLVLHNIDAAEEDQGTEVALLHPPSSSSSSSSASPLVYVGEDGVLRPLEGSEVNVGTGKLRFTSPVAALPPVLPQEVATRGWCLDVVGATWQLLEGGAANYAGGSVGINLAPGSAPSHALEVNGDVNITGRIMVDGEPLAPFGWSFSPSGLAHTSRRVSVGGQAAPPGWGLYVHGAASIAGGSIITVQGGVNGGPSRGIRLWTYEDTSWGIYAASTGGQTMAGAANPCAGAGGMTGLAMRFRCPASDANGFIFENDSGQCNMSLRGGDGSLYVRGSLGVGVEHPLEKMHVAGSLRVDGDVSFSGRLFRGGEEVDLESVQHVDSHWLEGAGGGIYVPEGVRVGVGTVAPQHALHVADPAHAALVVASDGDATVTVQGAHAALLSLSNGLGSSGRVGLVGADSTPPGGDAGTLPGAAVGDMVLMNDSAARSVHVATGGAVRATVSSSGTTFRGRTEVHGDLLVSGDIFLRRPGGDVPLTSLTLNYSTLNPAPAAHRGRLLAFDPSGAVTFLPDSHWDAAAGVLSLNTPLTVGGGGGGVPTLTINPVASQVVSGAATTLISGDVSVGGELAVGGALTVSGGVSYSHPPQVPPPTEDAHAVSRGYVTSLVRDVQDAWLASPGQDVVYAPAGRKVGVGIASPQAELDVVGDAVVSGEVRAAGVVLAGGALRAASGGEDALELFASEKKVARWDAKRGMSVLGRMEVRTAAVEPGATFTTQNGVLPPHTARASMAGNAPPSLPAIVARTADPEAYAISTDGGATWSQPLPALDPESEGWSGLLAEHRALVANVAYSRELDVFMVFTGSAPGDAYVDGEANRLHYLSTSSPWEWHRHGLLLEGGQGTAENPLYGILRHVDALSPLRGGGFLVLGASPLPLSRVDRPLGYETSDGTTWVPLAAPLPEGDVTDYRIRRWSGGVGLHLAAGEETSTTAFRRVARGVLHRVTLPIQTSAVAEVAGGTRLVAMRTHRAFSTSDDGGTTWVGRGDGAVEGVGAVTSLHEEEALNVTLALGDGVWVSVDGCESFWELIPPAAGAAWRSAAFNEDRRTITILAETGERVETAPIGEQAEMVVHGDLAVLGTATVHGQVTTLSDARLKSNIAPIENALDKVMRLRGVTYEAAGRSGVGFIAQELREVVPEAVRERPDGMLSVAYGSLAALLAQAVRELHAHVVVP